MVVEVPSSSIGVQISLCGQDSEIMAAYRQWSLLPAFTNLLSVNKVSLSLGT